MKIEVTHARRVAFDSKQQTWNGCDKENFPSSEAKRCWLSQTNKKALF